MAATPAGLQAPWLPPVSTHSQHWEQRFLHGCWVSELRSSCSHSKHFTHILHTQSLTNLSGYFVVGWSVFEIGSCYVAQACPAHCSLPFQCQNRRSVPQYPVWSLLHTAVHTEVLQQSLPPQNSQCVHVNSMTSNYCRGWQQMLLPLRNIP